MEQTDPSGTGVPFSVFPVGAFGLRGLGGEQAGKPQSVQAHHRPSRRKGGDGRMLFHELVQQGGACAPTGPWRVGEVSSAKPQALEGGNAATGNQSRKRPGDESLGLDGVTRGGFTGAKGGVGDMHGHLS